VVTRLDTRTPGGGLARRPRPAVSAGNRDRACHPYAFVDITDVRVGPGVRKGDEIRKRLRSWGTAAPADSAGERHIVISAARFGERNRVASRDRQ